MSKGSRGDVTYRRATRDELDIAVDWAAAEGWNPGDADADAFWATDPDGFVAAEHDGELIATGSIVSYGGRFGFMGFFIVRPDLRRQGIGRDFWMWRRDTLRRRLGDGAAIGMDGVFDMQPFYAAGGFRFAHRSIRMAGVGGHTIASEQSPDGNRLVELSTLPFDDVVAYDTGRFGCERAEFLREWITPIGGLGVAAVTGEAIAGIGVARPCRDGFKIGPLFADTNANAESLYAALSSHATARSVYLDVPECNADAVALASRHGLTEVFGCARMYNGAAPELPWNQIYGVTTFELG